MPQAPFVVPTSSPEKELTRTWETRSVTFLVADGKGPVDADANQPDLEGVVPSRNPGPGNNFPGSEASRLWVPFEHLSANCSKIVSY